MTLPDLADRHAALTDFQHNLVVTAGAGTGKTSLLVGRMVAALVLHHYEPYQVLPVTFTENAASEMRERLVRVLAAVEPWLAGADIEASDRFVLEQLGLGAENVSRVRDLLANVESISIHTFHGFCLQFLRDHAQQLRLPPDLGIVEVDGHHPGFDDVFHEQLRAATEGDVHPALERFDPADLRRLALSCAELPDDSLDRVTEVATPPDLAERCAAMEALLAEFPGAREGWRDAVDGVVRCYQALLHGETPDADDLPTKSPAAGKREVGARAEELKDTLTEHRHFLEQFVFADEAGIQDALDFVRPVIRRYREQLVAHGELGFQDLLLLTRRCLRQNRELRDAMAQRLRAILVDEFQDTDPLQYDIVFLLGCKPGTDHEDPMQLPLRDGTLFIVGDAKQSIYRFRRADVAAFARAVDCIVSQGGVELALNANFRSRRPILDFVNAVCTTTLAADRPYQFGYAPVVPMVEAEGDPVQVIAIESERKLPARAQREREGNVLIEEIQALHASGTKYEDMTILLRAMTETSWILRPLRAAGIPYVLEGSRRFYRRHEIILCGALLDAMVRPYDQAAILAILRSSLSDATDRDIMRHTREHDGLDLHQEDDGPVGACLALLRQWHQHVRALPVDTALNFLLTRPELQLVEASGFEGAQRIANIDKLRQRLTRRNPIDLADAAAILARDTKSESEDEESPLFDKGVEAVRLLTVHGAKGLEFPVVFLPDVARVSHHRDSSDSAEATRLFDEHGEESVTVRLGEAKNSAWWAHRNAGKMHDQAEQRRLFYVAATRAKDKLILLRSGHDSSSSQLWQHDLDTVQPNVDPRQGTGAVAAARARREEFDATPTLQAHRAFVELRDRLAAAAPQERVAPSQHTPARPRRGQQMLFELGGTAAASGPESTDGATTAKAAGTAMHHYLALVDLERDEPDAALLDSIDSPEAIRDMVRVFHASPIRRELAAKRVLREIPLSFREGEAAVNGVVDVLAIDADETVTILDWKTDDVTAATATERAEHYRPQLELYARGVQEACGAESLPRMAVHFLRLDRTIELA